MSNVFPIKKEKESKILACLECTEKIPKDQYAPYLIIYNSRKQIKEIMCVKCRKTYKVRNDLIDYSIFTIG